MGTNNYTPLTNLAILATLSTSVVNLAYEPDWLIPKMNHVYQVANDISGWKDNAFNKSADYQIHDYGFDNFKTIVEFSKNVLYNTKDIDSEYVGIVNDHFWDLL